ISTDPLPDFIVNHYSEYSDNLQKRLKLEKVRDNLTLSEFELSYYGEDSNLTLPNRISNSQDYWGVYNGKNNTTSIPTVKTSGWGDPAKVRVYFGANKEPDINFGRIGNLQKIIYPTGGFTEIFYEADNYIKPIYVPPV